MDILTELQSRFPFLPISFPSSCCIVVQGPISMQWPFMRQIIDSYAQFNPHVIWSTWATTAPSALSELEKRRIAYVLNDFPKQGEGFGNGNLMKHTTLAGILWAKQRNYKYIFKTRTDILINNLDRLLLRLVHKGDRINLLMWHNTYSHLIDQVMFGPIEDMLIMWNWHYIQCHTELQMMKEYFEKKQLDGSPTDINSIRKHFYFFAHDSFITNTKISWLKYGYPDLIANYVYGPPQAIY